MTASTPHVKWNEIQYLSWKEFRQMAPSIIQLEITRITNMMMSFSEDGDFYNQLVRARFELRQFVSALARVEMEAVEETCAPHLLAAIMSLSLQPPSLDLQTRDTCRYVLDRLSYIHHRLGLIY